MPRLAATVRTELELRRTTHPLATHSQQGQSLSQELKTARETDRAQISTLLHEELQQILQAGRMHLENVPPSSPDDDQSSQQLSRVGTALDEAAALTETRTDRFAPPVANQLLLDTIEWLATKTALRLVSARP